MKKVISNLGQSTVEYILLLLVVSSIAAVFFKSPLFQDMFGDDSGLFQSLASQIEFSYRHGYLGNEADRASDNFEYQSNSVEHKTYRSTQGSVPSHFFVPLEVYGAQ